MTDPTLVGNIKCLVCKGSGSIDEGFCHACLGTGYRATVAENVYLKSVGDRIDAQTISTNVFESYIVLEELDATEHNGLTDAQKTGVLHLLACGSVDLNDGKAGKTRLWNWFGAESTTVASLTALLS
jgi:hypothetical protein